MKDSSHYYDPTGKAVFEVPNKSKPGMRPTTLRDARALGLLPSVTTVLSVLSRPQLDDWKHRQITGWCASNPPPTSLDLDGYHAAAMEGAFQQVSDAADLGTDIHKALEQHFQGQPYDPAFKPYIEPVDAWVKKEGVTFLGHELRLVNKAHGYAGTTDAAIQCPHGRGILDFKSRKTKPGQAVTPYDTQPMQIAAYHIADFLEVLNSDCGVNLFISTTEPGRVDACWFDAAQLRREWQAFEAALVLYRHIKGYDPRSVTPA